MDDVRLRDISAAAGEYGLPVWRLRELVTAGIVPHRRIGRRVYFTQEDLREGLRRMAEPAAAAGRAG